MQNPGTRWRGLLLAGLVLPLAACEVPTSMPNWNTLWIAPAQGTAIPVTALLPAGISRTTATEFLLSIPPAEVERTLGEVCPICALGDGLVAPKPEFTLTASPSAPLPDDVISASLASGRVRVALSHDFSFDPLRPSATARGYLLLVARSGETTLVRDSIDGSTTAWPRGTVLKRTLTINPAVLTTGVTVSLTLYSPAGDPVRIDADQKLTITSAPGELRVSEAEIRVVAHRVDAEEVALDLGDIDEVITDHQRGGAILLDVSNPFAVAGDLTLVITAPDAVITKPFALQTGDFTARVELSESELDAILGRSPVQLSAWGVVSAPEAGTTVKPSQSVAIDSRLELTIGSGEGS
jgi:hypothetical protein